MDITLPKFANAKKMKKLFGISSCFLEALVVQDYVRSVKHTETKQGSRLYKVKDIEDVFEKMSAGRRPHKQIKQGEIS